MVILKHTEECVIAVEETVFEQRMACDATESGIDNKMNTAIDVYFRGKKKRPRPCGFVPADRNRGNRTDRPCVSRREDHNC